MKTWITGARGFIGRHVARTLAVRGENVAGIGHGAWIDADRAEWGVDSWCNGEITLSNLDRLASDFGRPDAIIHLAGGSAVGASLAMPAEDFYRTVTSTATLLEWVRIRAADARVVVASSAAVYGSGYIVPIDEAETCRPYSPYGSHKRMTELLAESYARNFGVRSAIVRLFSVYGPELRKQLLWDACVRIARGTAVLELGGTGSELRDWLHVNDAARLMVSLVDHASVEAPVFNGGTGIAASISQIAQTLCTLWGGETVPVFTGVARPGDPERLVARVDRASALGFDARITWTDGLAEYVQWFRSQAELP